MPHRQAIKWNCQLLLFFILLGLTVFLTLAVHGMYLTDNGRADEILGLEKTVISFIDYQQDSSLFLPGLIYGLSLLSVMAWLAAGWHLAEKTWLQQTASSAANKTFDGLPRLPDQETESYLNGLGIIINGREAIVPVSLFHLANPAILAKSIGWLLYLHYGEMESEYRHYEVSALHRLADLLIDNYGKHDLNAFIRTVGKVKDYLAAALTAAVARRILERDIEKLRQETETIKQEERECRAQLENHHDFLDVYQRLLKKIS